MKVQEYLNSALEWLGIIPIDQLSYTIYDKLEYKSIDKVLEKIYHSFFNPTDLQTTENMELLFESLKEVQLHNDSQSFEGVYWRKNGLLECKNLQEFINSKKWNLQKGI